MGERADRIGGMIDRICEMLGVDWDRRRRAFTDPDGHYYSPEDAKRLYRAALQMSEHKPSACCEGERCFCGLPASAKVEETIFHDDWSKRDDGPNGHMPPALRGRHPLTAYVCEEHFNQIMRRGRHADAV
jgi:hypothetical protein